MVNGIPPQAFDFYQALSLDNSKDFWMAHKGDYEQQVRDPLKSLLAELEEEFGEGKLFRPYRDVRFSKDKSPYKDHQGAYVPQAEGMGYYMQVGREHFLVGAGWYKNDPAQLKAYRRAAAGPRGPELQEIVESMRKQGVEIGGDLMKTLPRGTPADHPQAALLAHRSLIAMRTVDDIDSLAGTGALKLVRRTWRECRPMIEWLVEMVGVPTEEEP